MKPERIRSRRAWLVLCLVAAAPACSYEHHDSEPPPVPVFVETERNDSAFEANYFGVLHPGDRFFIDGDITDIPFDPVDPFNGHDPYDGFAFTAGQPIHVEFALWEDHAGADLDVCIFDPQLGLEVGCFATAAHPERGAVDVLAGGFDFHLVLQSFVGISSYSLEVVVYGLVPSTAAPGGGQRAGAAGVVVPSIRRAGAAKATAVVPAAETRPTGLAGYAHPRTADVERFPVERLRVLALDVESGETTSSSLLLFSDGSWMGIPDEGNE